MGLFFIGLLFVLIGVPAGVVVLIDVITTKSARLVKWFFVAGIAGVCLIILLYALSPLWTKMDLEPKDYQGTYIIDRSFYPGRQADWQYNHFRFEVLPSDSVLFHVTEGAKIVATYKGKARWWTADSRSARMRLDMDSPTHFIVASNPATYRFVWNFRLVFATSRFGNVAFKRSMWEAL